MNTTPQGERTRIVFLGRCNAGKSSLMNAIVGQPVAIVSPVKGTTTDPVRKAMEILPIGPVLLCDTPGLDDSGALGNLRMERTLDELRQGDLALIVTDAAAGIGPLERKLASSAKSLGIPSIVVLGRSDIYPVDEETLSAAAESSGLPAVAVSALNNTGIEELKLAMIKALPEDRDSRRLAADLVASKSIVILVVPIDSAAPKGRLILPQQQVIRDLLEAGVMPLVTRETELNDTLEALVVPPALVITDSQAFAQVAKIVPPSIPLTSFSILFARYKGDIVELINGARAVSTLKDGDRILIAEGCTHHRQADDIGTVKIPKLLCAKTCKHFEFGHTSGMRYPDNLADYALIVHCGACMLNRREMLYRIECARNAGVPIVNYGVLLALLNGILDRAVSPLSCHSKN